jgi:hypothetical protein
MRVHVDQWPTQGEQLFAVLLSVKHSNFVSAMLTLGIFLLSVHERAYTIYSALFRLKQTHLNWKATKSWYLVRAWKKKKKKSGSTSYPVFPDFRKNIAFFKVPRLRPFVLLVTVTCRWRPKHSDKPSPCATKNSTRRSSESNSYLRGERPASDHALSTSQKTHFAVNAV